MAQSKRKQPAATRPGAPDEVAAAYRSTEGEIKALAADVVGRVTTDIPTAVSLALGALPRIQSLVPDMEGALKKPPVAALGRLRARALAALYAHLRWAPRTPRSHDEDLEEARALREQLLAAADAHVKYGDVDAEAVAKIREGSGLLDRANDLIALAALFRAVWDKITGRTPVTEAQLRRATELGTQLVVELGAKALGTGDATGGANWSDLRTRAFRLFMNDYDELRRAVEYVRYHEEDADSFTPPLHQRKRGSAAEAETDKPDAGSGGDSGTPTSST
jgi:hypothetical protein